MQNSSIDRVVDRIRTIESRIQSITGGFEGPPPSTFAEKLQTVRKSPPPSVEKPADPPAKPQIFEGDPIDKPQLKGPSNSVRISPEIIHRQWTPADRELETLSRLVAKSRYPDSMARLAKTALIKYKKPEAVDQLTETYRKNPKKIVTFDEYPMQAETAFKFRKLKKLISEKFPGRGIYVTSTMGGRHSSPAHPAGRAVDFVVDRLTRDESTVVEKLAKDCGFWAFNEYIHDSTYKTGDHMHIEL